MLSLKQQKLLSLLAWMFRKGNSGFEIYAAKPPIIIPASYSTLKDKPADATLQNLKIAISLARASGGIVVCCFGCSHPFSKAELVERAYKEALLRASGVRYILTKRPIINSIDEMRAVKEVSDKESLDYSGLVCIVTCDFHSWAMWLLARMILRSKKIMVFCNTYKFEVQPDHPTPDQRTWSRWLPMSAARLTICLLAYVLVPLRKKILDRCVKIRHKAAHE
jgi:hypothetical protein